MVCACVHLIALLSDGSICCTHMAKPLLQTEYVADLRIHHRTASIEVSMSSEPQSETLKTSDTSLCYKRKRDGKSLLGCND